MKKRLFSAFLVLCFVVAGLVTIPNPTTAQATANIISLPDMAPRYLFANESGSFNASSCTDNPTEKPAGKWLASDGAVRATLPGSNSGLTCLYANEGIGFESGVQFATRTTTTSKELVAWKNDRVLWSSALPTPPHCERWVGEYAPKNFTMGADGNVYFIMTDSNYCDNLIMGVNPDTGAVVLQISLGAGPTPYRTAGWSKLGLWTYEDRIMVVDQNGMVHEFGYNGTENLSAQHQFPLPYGQYMYWLQANEAGSIFGLTVRSTGDAPSQLFYYKKNGNTGVIGNNYGSDGLSLTADGNVVGTYPVSSGVSTFNTSTNTVSVTNLVSLTTGYSNNFIRSYLEDAAGNKLYVWYHSNASGSESAISVEVKDNSTSATSRVFLKEMKNGNSSFPFFRVTNLDGFEFTNSVQDGSLYFAICVETGCNSSGSSATPSSEIHKIDLGSFGTPMSKSYQRFEYESQKLEYVAMGDSFASGEGLDPYLPGTNINSPNENRCHRSENAYAMQLEEDPALDLNLTAFVACSGAESVHLSYGGSGLGAWDEPTQVDAISSSTDVVTLSIGGNDMGFETFARACVTGNCDEYSTPYTTAFDNINNLDNDLEYVYSEILNKLPSTGKLYVVNYPMLVPQGKTTSDIMDLNCHYLYNGSVVGSTNANPWGNGRAVEDIIARLNAKIETVVYAKSLVDPRIHYVDINTGSFDGHDICSSDPYFNNNYLDRPDVFHPNEQGVEIIRDIIAAQL